jgi:hypothetical protein
MKAVEESTLTENSFSTRRQSGELATLDGGLVQ